MITKIEDFKNFLNESSAEVHNRYPRPVQVLEMLLRMDAMKHHDMPNVWEFDLPLQVMFNNNTDGTYGKYGFQIADEDGKPLYMGIDPDEAFRIINENI